MSTKPQKPDSLERRMKMLRAEAEAARKRYRAHEQTHGCYSWLYDFRTGHLVMHWDRQCAVRVLLRDVWIQLDEATQLPSRDPYMYRDAPEEWTAPLVATGEQRATMNG